MTEVRTNRRLAAILAANVVSYSRLMAKDETGTLTSLKHHREVGFAELSWFALSDAPQPWPEAS